MCSNPQPPTSLNAFQITNINFEFPYNASFSQIQYVKLQNIFLQKQTTVSFNFLLVTDSIGARCFSPQEWSFKTCWMIMPLNSPGTNQDLNSLGPSDSIWCWRSGSTLAQVMACCLTAPSHYLNQCWLIISKVLWHSSEDIIIRWFEDINQYSKIEDYIFKITLRSPRGQWVKWVWQQGRTCSTLHTIPTICMKMKSTCNTSWEHPIFGLCCILSNQYFSYIISL